MLSAAQDLRLCEKASGAIGSYPSQHDADHGEIDPGFFAAGEQLVVLPQTPAGAEPGKGAFPHPAPRQDLESAGPARPPPPRPPCPTPPPPPPPPRLYPNPL